MRDIKIYIPLYQKHSITIFRNITNQRSCGNITIFAISRIRTTRRIKTQLKYLFFLIMQINIIQSLIPKLSMTNNNYGKSNTH